MGVWETPRPWVFNNLKGASLSGVASTKEATSPPLRSCRRHSLRKAVVRGPNCIQPMPHHVLRVDQERSYFASCLVVSQPTHSCSSAYKQPPRLVRLDLPTRDEGEKGTLHSHTSCSVTTTRHWRAAAGRANHKRWNEGQKTDVPMRPSKAWHCSAVAGLAAGVPGPLWKAAEAEPQSDWIGTATAARAGVLSRRATRRRSSDPRNAPGEACEACH
ncbi:hypothetical protein VUR80DRAFT_9582 [Thermomyces stellatus]